MSRAAGQCDSIKSSGLGVQPRRGTLQYNSPQLTFLQPPTGLRPKAPDSRQRQSGVTRRGGSNPNEVVAGGRTARPAAPDQPATRPKKVNGCRSGVALRVGTTRGPVGIALRRQRQQSALRCTVGYGRPVLRSYSSFNQHWHKAGQAGLTCWSATPAAQQRRPRQCVNVVLIRHRFGLAGTMQ